MAHFPQSIKLTGTSVDSHLIYDRLFCVRGLAPLTLAHLSQKYLDMPEEGIRINESMIRDILDDYRRHREHLTGSQKEKLDYAISIYTERESL